VYSSLGRELAYQHKQLWTQNSVLIKIRTNDRSAPAVLDASLQDTNAVGRYRPIFTLREQPPR
jgi:hypothetical protein